MKRFLLLALFLTGCSDGPAFIKQRRISDWTAPTPKFKYGTRVVVTEGFYKDVEGFIIDHAPCYDKAIDNLTICYGLEEDLHIMVKPLKTKVMEKFLLEKPRE